MILIKLVFKIPQTIGFILYYLWEVFVSSLQVAWEVLTPRHRMTPGIVGVPLSATKDTEITLLANLITMTPGTMSVDVSEDRKTLYVYGLYVNDRVEFARHIKQKLESKVIRLFQ